MPVVIEELTADVTPETSAPGEGEPRPAEGPAVEAVLDATALQREREVRLAVD
jgi:hypothetical protein